MEGATGALPGPQGIKLEIPRIDKELDGFESMSLEHQIQALAAYDARLRRVLEDMQSHASS